MNLVRLLKYMQENYGEQITNHPMAGNEVAKNFKKGAKTVFETFLLEMTIIYLHPLAQEAGQMYLGLLCMIKKLAQVYKRELI